MNWVEMKQILCEDCHHYVQESWYWVKNGNLDDIVYYCECEEE